MHPELLRHAQANSSGAPRRGSVTHSQLGGTLGQPRGTGPHLPPSGSAGRLARAAASGDSGVVLVGDGDAKWAILQPLGGWVAVRAARASVAPGLLPPPVLAPPLLVPPPALRPEVAQELPVGLLGGGAEPVSALVLFSGLVPGSVKGSVRVLTLVSVLVPGSVKVLALVLVLPEVSVSGAPLLGQRT